LDVVEGDWHLPCEQIDHQWRGAAIWHVHHFNSSLSFEHDAGDVRDRTGSKGPKAEFARIGPYISNQLGNRRNRECGVYLQHFCRTSKPRDHRNVAYEIEIKIGV
jgi:hypothetical protein